MLLAQVVTLDVIGHGITLSEREAEELRHAGRRRRGPINRQARPLTPSRARTFARKATVALTEPRARELAE
jgi:hypothetical protein